MKINKYIICSIVVVIVLIIVYLNMYKINGFVSRDIIQNIYFTYFTFTSGFTYNAYVNINNTNKANELKKNHNWKSIDEIYKITMYLLFVGLIMSFILLVAPKNVLNNVVFNVTYEVYLLGSVCLVFNYWKFVSDFLRITD